MQQGKGAGGKTVKGQVSEKQGKGSISQTEVLRSKASVTLLKAVFFPGKVLPCFCFKWMLYESLLMGYEYKCNIMVKVTWEKRALQLSSNERRHLIKWPHFQKHWTSYSSARFHYILFPKCWALTLWLTLLRPQQCPGDGQEFGKHMALTYLLEWQTSLAFVSHFLPFTSENLKPKSNV